MCLNTLKNHREFVMVSSSSVKRYSEFFIILCARIDHFDRFTVGFTASKKLGNSVKRNFAKRRMRVLMQDFLKYHSVLDTTNIGTVVIAKKSLLTCDWKRLKKDFNNNMKIALDNLER